ncbi:serine hydrolase [Streptomyces sp. NPDC001415]
MQDGGPGALTPLQVRLGGAVLTSGVADLKSHAPMREDSRFRIGSMTKPFVATAPRTSSPAPTGPTPTRAARWPACSSSG